MASIQPLSLIKRARKGLSSLLFDEDEQQFDSPLRSVKADPVTGDQTEPVEVDPGVEDARQGYLQSLEGQKIKDISKFFTPEPEEPEFDEERNEDLRNLSKVNAIAAFVDALSQVVPRARSDASDRPTAVTPRSNMLGMNALEMLRRQDLTFEQKMDRFRQELRQAEDANRKMSLRNQERNNQIDTEVAATELELARNDAALKAAQQQIKLEEELADEEAWEELAFRLASNGQPEAAVQAMISSGKDKEEANRIVSKMRGGNDDPNEFEVTPRMKNMAKRLKTLRGQIDSGDAMMHYTTEGKPMSAAAREAEQIREMLGENMYADEIMEIIEGKQASGGRSPEQEQAISENQQLFEQLKQTDDEDEQQEIVNKLYKNGEKLGLSEQEIQQEIATVMNPGSEYNQAQTLRRNQKLIQKIRSTADEEQRKDFINQLVESMKDQGYSEQQIRQEYLRLIGSGSAQEATGSVAEGQQGEQGQGQGASAATQPSGGDETMKGKGSEQVEPGQPGSELSEEEVNDLLAKIELEMARGEEGSFSREMAGRLMQLLIGYDSQGRRFPHSAADILKSPFTEGVPRLYQQFIDQKGQAEERRKELMEKFMEQNQDNE
nr:hypothetical protein 24 [Balneolaceae bacterium]